MRIVKRTKKFLHKVNIPFVKKNEYFSEPENTENFDSIQTEELNGEETITDNVEDIKPVEEINDLEDTKSIDETEVLEEKKSNNKKKNKKNMVTEEQITSAENMANVLGDTKVIKKDKGLIERTESSKIILTEDNRQLLND